MNICRHLFLLLALLWPVLSWAAHPLITDDPETQGKGKFQLEVNGQYDRDKENQAGVAVKSAASELKAIFSYGIEERIDIVLGMPRVKGKVWEDGVTVYNESGVSDILVEIKWRLYEREGFRLALKPGIVLPSGNDKRGLGAGKAGYSAFFIVSDEVKPWDFFLNLGYKRNENTEVIDERRDLWYASLAASCELTNDIKAVADIGTETNVDRFSDRDPVFALAGVIYSPVEDLDLDVGVKKGLNRPEAGHSYLAGITARF